MSYYVVVVAAGRGTRMGADRNKVLLLLKGVPVIIRTLQVFENDPACGGIVLVVRKNEIPQFRKLTDTFEINKIMAFATGGPERQESVRNGLNVLEAQGAGQNSVILIHDGARPFIGQDRIAAVAEAADGQGAALLAVPVKDTIKQARGNHVDKTLERKTLWAAQTPQAFRLSVILRAHDQGRKDQYQATDDASLAEHLGVPVTLVKGSYRNIKLTSPEDMMIAEKFIEEEETEHARRSRI
ncbi:2-C-methyl-D-erythritol 4-phosphate cytidylyltransferase [Sporolactobacillus vineae]|uniref:2-C-methyl-D-erythritol 4-phosphate cytidylyltransferase n=1 Tax=Sporolactobacillus vineae TaxID=444463 RepID=UPI001872A97B|nr:2-C-methyl-D-erythritol 4-phosphate cytidylyltransferase [Sporolactobacillus vineae]